MKNLLIFVVLLFAAGLCGCGMVNSYPERERRYVNIVDYQARQVVDDWDYMWLMERPSYLTIWPVRRGN